MERENPYANPTAHARDMEPTVWEKYTPAFIGVAIGLGIFYAVTTIWSPIYIWTLTVSGVPSKDLYRYIYQSTGVLTFSHMVAIFAEATGGYWCVKLSPSRPLTNIALSIVISCALTLVQLLSPFAYLIPLWSRGMSLLTPIIGFIVGARYAMRKTRRNP